MNAINRVIIFGATSAIAEQAARQLVQQGASVYCIGRNPDKLSTVINDLKARASQAQVIDGVSADLTDQQTHTALINDAINTLGGLDAVLIAHGSLPDQKACESDVSKAMQELNINALSVISLMTILANHLEAQRSGVIAVISSVAGDRGRQSNYIYGAAKGMVSLFAEGLRNRLASSGVDVVTIKPGFVDTPMTAEFDRSGPLWAQPETVARGIIHAMTRGKNNVYLPGFWSLIMFIIKHIPETVFKRLSL